ncbi:UbiA family prenyltransferase [Geodermatophilus sp. URMC 65]
MRSSGSDGTEAFGDKTFGRKLSAWMTLLRVRSCVSGSLALILGAWSPQSNLPPGNLLIGAAATWTAIAHANILNDIIDQKIDAVDQSWRPLPSGTLSQREAVTGYVVCCLASVGLGFAAGSPLDIWSAACIALSPLYSICLKGTVLLGNAFIAVMATSPLVVGALMAGGVRSDLILETIVIAIAMLSFEVNKTARDLQGDEAGGLRTVATCFGANAAIKLGMTLLGAASLIAASICFVSLTCLTFSSIFLAFVTLPVFVRYRGLMSSSVGGTRLDAREAEILFHTMQKTWKFVFVALVVSSLRS